MDLKDFVSETIVQISQGIMEAQEKTKELGAVINPPTKGPADGNLFTTVGNIDYVVQKIDFDICVSVESSNSKESKGKLGVVTAFVGGKVEKGTEENSANQSVNRIKFSIPCLLPWGKIQNQSQISPYSR